MKKDDSVKNILKKHIVLNSRELIDCLKEQYSLVEGTAKVRIARAVKRGEIKCWRFFDLSFYCSTQLIHDKDKKEFLNHIAYSISKSDTYFSNLFKLYYDDNRQNLNIDNKDFQIFILNTNQNYSKSKKNINYISFEKQLKEIGFKIHYDKDLRNFEKEIITHFKIWLSLNGFVPSSNQISDNTKVTHIRTRYDRNPKPDNQVLYRYFHLTAPCYLYSLGDNNRSIKQGYIVADFVKDYNININVNYFIEKIKYIQYEKKHPTLIFFLFENIEEESLIALKKKGIIATSIKYLFGEQTVRAMIAYCTDINLYNLSKYIIYLKNNHFAYIQKKKGEYFETFIYLICRKYLDKNLWNVSKNLKFYKGGEEKVEIDIVCQSNTSYHFFELKNYKKSIKIEKKHIEKWDNQITNIIKYYIKDTADKKLSFYFLTTSDFSEEALSTLQKLIEKYRKKEIRIYYKNNHQLKDSFKKLKLFPQDDKEHIMNTFEDLCIK